MASRVPSSGGGQDLLVNAAAGLIQINMPHLPEIVAAELGFYLEQTPEEQRSIRHMIEDDIAAAARAGDTKRVGVLKMVLAHRAQHHEHQDGKG